MEPFRKIPESVRVSDISLKNEKRKTSRVGATVVGESWEVI